MQIWTGVTNWKEKIMAWTLKYIHYWLLNILRKPTSRYFLVPGWAQWYAIIEGNWPNRTASADLFARLVEKTKIWLCCCIYWASILPDCLLITLLGKGWTPLGGGPAVVGSPMPNGKTESHVSGKKIQLPSIQSIIIMISKLKSHLTQLVCFHQLMVVLEL